MLLITVKFIALMYKRKMSKAVEIQSKVMIKKINARGIYDKLN